MQGGIAHSALFFCSSGNCVPYFAVFILYFPPPLLYNKGKKEVNAMRVRERILALRLLEKQEQHPDYAERIGIQVNMMKQDPEERED